MSSKDGTIGKDMSGALDGTGFPGQYVSPRFKGMPRNAYTGYTGPGKVSVPKYTQNVMQRGRAKNKK